MSDTNLPALPNNEQISDFERARSAIHNIMDSGKTALEELLAIASQSQHPRAYEAAAGLIDSLVAASKELVDIQAKNTDESNNSVDSNPDAKLFVSTAELQQMIARAQNGS